MWPIFGLFMQLNVLFGSFMCDARNCAPVWYQKHRFFFCPDWRSVSLYSLNLYLPKVNSAQYVCYQKAKQYCAVKEYPGLDSLV